MSKTEFIENQISSKHKIQSLEKLGLQIAQYRSILHKRATQKKKRKKSKPFHFPGISLANEVNLLSYSLQYK